jgi:hypothetical protein
VPLREGAGDPRSVLHGPYALAVSPTSGEVWVSCLEGQDVHVLQPDTLTFDAARARRLTGTPYFGQVTADGATLYVPTQAPDLVVEVDTASGAVRRQVRVDEAGCTRAHQLMLLGDGAEAALVCEGETGQAGVLLVLDVGAGVVRHTLPVGVRPDYVGLLPARGAP